MHPYIAVLRCRLTLLSWDAPLHAFVSRRYLAGQKEYEVELQFSSGMLAYPDRVDTGGEQYRDGEPPVPGSLLDIQSLQQTSQG